jgi:hypothetical protein
VDRSPGDAPEKAGASELAAVSTDVQARARLALDSARHRRGEPSPGD